MAAMETRAMGAIRPLGAPNAVTVTADQAVEPCTVQRVGWRTGRRVLSVEDRWRIDDEWWRERPVARCYFRVQLEDGLVLSVYHDLATGAWYEQRG